MLLAATCFAAFSDLAMAAKDRHPRDDPIKPDNTKPSESDPDAARVINSDTPLDVTDKGNNSTDTTKKPVKDETVTKKLPQPWLQRALQFGPDNTFRIV